MCSVTWVICGVQSEVEDLIWEVDEDCDQAIDWEEFQKTYQRCNKDTTGAVALAAFNARHQSPKMLGVFISVC